MHKFMLAAHSAMNEAASFEHFLPLFLTFAA